MKNKELLFGTILSYAQQIFSIALGLFYTPFLLAQLGKGEYGLYSTVSATISMINLLSLGLGNGYIRYYARYDRIGDSESKKKLNGLFLSIFLALGCIALLVGLVLSNNLSWIFEKGLSEAEYVIGRRLALILSVSVAISFPATVFNAIITAHERFIFAKLVGLIRTIMAPIITIPLLLCGYKSVAVVTVSLIVSIIANIGLCVYVLFALREKFVFNDFEKGLTRSLLIYTLPIALNLFIDQINWNIDKLLIGRFYGTDEVAIYNIGYTIFVAYMSLSTAVSNVFTPRVHAMVVKNIDDKRALRIELTALFAKVGRIQAEILFLVLTGMIFFGMPFITELWVGPGFEASYYILLILAISCTVPLIQNLGIEIQRAENLHKFRSIVYSAMAVANLVLSIYLCRLYGGIGSAIGTAISFVLCNGIIMNIYYHKRCSIDIIAFWKSISRIVLSLVPPVLIWLGIRRFFDLTSWFTFFVGVVVYSIIYCISIWLIGMNDEERKIIKNFIALMTSKALNRKNRAKM